MKEFIYFLFAAITFFAGIFCIFYYQKSDEKNKFVDFFLIWPLILKNRDSKNLKTREWFLIAVFLLILIIGLVIDR